MITPDSVLGAGRIVPVFTVTEPSTVVAVGRGLLDGGIECVEVTLRTAHGWDAIATLRRELPELTVGVGTVLTAAHVDRAVETGAQFLVAPGLSEAAVERAAAHEILSVPGVATPSEIMRAIHLGLDTVKVFPASQLGGPAYLRALSSVFPDLRFVPSGGLSAANAADYLDVPAVRAVSGSWMLPADAVATGDSARIAELSAAAVAALGTVR